MPIPQAGDKAPAFQVPDQDGTPVSLAQFAGRSVVLYFYPKDDTPGCTVEACGFRDEHSALEAAGAVVLGVSADSTASHRKFANKFNLPFPLLADVDHALSEAYGVWGEKSLYGRKFLGITRATFLIGPDGVVKQVWPKVKVNGHVAEVMAALKGEAPSASDAGAKKAPAAKKPSAGKKVAAAKKAPAGKTAASPKAATPRKAAGKSAKARTAPAGKAATPRKAAGKGANARTAPAGKAAATRKVAGKGAKARTAPAGKAAAKKAPTVKKPGAAKKAARKASRR
ncbi:thioredoxin-dependent thiol peroxidase [Corallococcus macrosporus]|uniref:thioredoxin-dependent peroxiredoxin n=1 Tax=Corallococcus macrosporus DSM 14697 TaxID=1189310 RepID=A0A250K432_9BACT|nr:thioredoxin-dependent thiol peroxidase [Corallococcus macrosporus]ATB50660.1 peroxiredoxin [Corallococcus macrosporus DSM 14697]